MGDRKIADIFDSINFLYTHNPDSRWRVRMEFDRKPEAVALQFNRDVYLAMVGSDPEWTIDETLRNVELLPELKNYKGPALIMGGRYDWASPPITQIEIANALKGSELVIFERSGHLLHEDEPIRFVNVVIGFVQHVSRTR